MTTPAPSRGPHPYAGIVAVAVAAVVGWSVYRGATRPNRVLSVPAPVTAVGFSPDGRKLSALAGEKSFGWDTTTWEPAAATAVDLQLAGPVFSTDRKRFVSLDGDRVSVFDADTRRLLRQARVPGGLRDGGIRSLALSPRWLAAAYGNAERTDIVLWDVSR